MFKKNIKKQGACDGHCSKSMCFFQSRNPGEPRETSSVRTSILSIWKSEPYMLDACLGNKVCRKGACVGCACMCTWHRPRQMQGSHQIEWEHYNSARPPPQRSSAVGAQVSKLQKRYVNVGPRLALAETLSMPLMEHT